MLVWLVSIIAPFFLAFYSKGLWLEEASARVIPKVAFKHQALVTMAGSTPGSILQWSTEPALNAMLGDSLRSAEIESYEKDANFDGAPESAHIKITMPLKTVRGVPEQVYSASCLLVFQYKIDDMTTLEMESLAFVGGSTAVPASELWLDGDLRLRQTSLLAYHGEHIGMAEAGLLRPAVPRLASVSPKAVLAGYLGRNLTTYVDNPTAIWTAGAGGAGGSFTLDVTLRFPPEYVRYRPGFFQTVKMAWVQYLSLLLVVRWLARLALEFVYDHRLFDTTLLAPQKINLKPDF